jgi:N-ethylmaleimide reductase
MSLFESYPLGDLKLRNRVVMAPMTRNRAPGNVPNELMVEYYRQRASAGLIITEGVGPSPNGVGYARQPGGYSAAQTAGWKKVVAAVHAAGGSIFMQQMHTGRIGHPLNLPKGGEIIGPSAVGAAGTIFTDQSGPQPYPVPRALRTDEIAATMAEFVQTSRNAIEAGFDGIELHGANGYLIEQFLQPRSNVRTDAYGGSLENRNRFAVETAAAVAKAIGPGRTGIRLSPFNTFNDLAVYPEIPEQYELLARELGKLKLAYIHIVHYTKVGEPLLQAIKKAFGGPIIVCGDLNKAKAEAALAAGYADLAAFAKAFIANPDFVRRLQDDLPLATPDVQTFYAGGDKGYADYPALP